MYRFCRNEGDVVAIYLDGITAFISIEQTIGRFKRDGVLIDANVLIDILQKRTIELNSCTYHIPKPEPTEVEERGLPQWDWSEYLPKTYSERHSFNCCTDGTTYRLQINGLNEWSVNIGEQYIVRQEPKHKLFELMRWVEHKHDYFVDWCREVLAYCHDEDIYVSDKANCYQYFYDGIKPHDFVKNYAHKLYDLSKHENTVSLEDIEFEIPEIEEEQL